MKKLAIITTHPIQYNAPLFALLTTRELVNVKIFYTWGEEVLKNKYDPGFDKIIEWDIPLLDGYEYSFVKNEASSPGSHHFKGIDNPALIEDIKDWGPNAVLVYGWAFKSHLKALRYFHNRIPVYFRGDSILWEEENKFKKWAKKIFLKWVYTHVDKALYVGTLNKKYFLNYGLKESQLVFAPHAIDNERFLTDVEKNKQEALQWRGKIGISPGELVFLYAGKLDANKNTRFLLKAFISLKNKGAHLVIAGNGEQESLLKTEFNHYDNIHFLPFQNQMKMPVLYFLADAFILPSLTETWGLSINEAMVCGCAVIVSCKAGASADLVAEGKNGYIFNPRNEEELKSVMSKMIANPYSVKKLGRCSENKIKESSNTKSCEVIESLMNNNN